MANTVLIILVEGYATASILWGVPVDEGQSVGNSLKVVIRLGLLCRFLI